MNNLREEILAQIHRYQNIMDALSRSIAEETKEIDRSMLISRKEAYRLDMIPTLKRLLEMIPAQLTATIWMKFPDGEYKYGTYDYNTPGEKVRVNEMAMQLRYDRHCDTEVRVDK